VRQPGRTSPAGYPEREKPPEPEGPGGKHAASEAAADGVDSQPREETSGSGAHRVGDAFAGEAGDSELVSVSADFDKLCAMPGEHPCEQIEGVGTLDTRA
jgi:hypothetical protein